MLRILTVAAVLTVAALFGSSAQAQGFGPYGPTTYVSPYASVPVVPLPAYRCRRPVFPPVVIVRPRPVYYAPVFVHPSAFGYYVPF